MLQGGSRTRRERPPAQSTALRAWQRLLRDEADEEGVLKCRKKRDGRGRGEKGGEKATVSLRTSGQGRAVPAIEKTCSVESNRTAPNARRRATDVEMSKRRGLQ